MAKYVKLTTAEREARKNARKEALLKLEETVQEEYQDFSFSELTWELNNLVESLSREELQIRVRVLKELIAEASMDCELDSDEVPRGNNNRQYC